MGHGRRGECQRIGEMVGGINLHLGNFVIVKVNFFIVSDYEM